MRNLIIAAQAGEIKEGGAEYLAVRVAAQVTYCHGRHEVS